MTGPISKPSKRITYATTNYLLLPKLAWPHELVNDGRTCRRKGDFELWSLTNATLARVLSISSSTAVTTAVLGSLLTSAGSAQRNNCCKLLFGLGQICQTTLGCAYCRTQPCPWSSWVALPLPAGYFARPDWREASLRMPGCPTWLPHALTHSCWTCTPLAHPCLRRRHQYDNRVLYLQRRVAPGVRPQINPLCTGVCVCGAAPQAQAAPTSRILAVELLVSRSLARQSTIISPAWFSTGTVPYPLSGSSYFKT